MDGAGFIVGAVLLAFTVAGFFLGYAVRGDALPPVCEKVSNYYDEQGKTYLLHNKKKYGYCVLLAEDPK